MTASPSASATEIEMGTPRRRSGFVKKPALSMNATGKVVLNLKALEANAQASGEAADLLNVKTVDGSEKVEINSAFDVKMAVTYEVAETIEQGKKKLKEAESVRVEAEEAAEELEEAQE